MMDDKLNVQFTFPQFIKWSHLGLAVFGVTSYLSAELAEHSDGFGYYLHAYLGLTLLVFLVSRVAYGVVGQKFYRFSSWWPFNRAYYSSVKEDLRAISRLNIPGRNDHCGLSGLVQMFGLLIFSWMAITGATIFFISDKYGLILDLHEIGESLVPLFLFVHVGAVIVHIIFGKKGRDKIFPFIS